MPTGTDTPFENGVNHQHPSGFRSRTSSSTSGSEKHLPMSGFRSRTSSSMSGDEKPHLTRQSSLRGIDFGV